MIYKAIILLVDNDDEVYTSCIYNLKPMTMHFDEHKVLLH